MEMYPVPVVKAALNKPKLPKLPKLSLKNFYGESTSWPSWWDSFYSAVHANKSLSEIDKFNYLRSLLEVEGQASSAIAGLQLTAGNYTEAIDILRSRYGNKQIIISGYMDTLLKLPVATSLTGHSQNQKHI